MRTTNASEAHSFWHKILSNFVDVIIYNIIYIVRYDFQTQYSYNLNFFLVKSHSRRVKNYRHFWKRVKIFHFLKKSNNFHSFGMKFHSFSRSEILSLFFKNGYIFILLKWNETECIT